MASDLHRLVSVAAPQPRPLLLAGAELGSLVVRLFAHKHPQDVAGLVLLEPLSETLFDPVANPQDPADRSTNPWTEHWFGHLLPSCRMLQLAAATGATRLGLLTGLLAPPFAGAGAEEVVRQKHQLCDPFHLQVRCSYISEWRITTTGPQAVWQELAGVNVSLAQVAEAAARPLAPSIPVAVVSGTAYDEQMPAGLVRGWSRAVQAVVGRTAARHTIVSGGDRHMARREGMVGEALAPLLRMVRAGGPEEGLRPEGLRD
jgi:pimeloyl-ACP methyl ester carboxylesterase